MNNNHCGIQFQQTNTIFINKKGEDKILIYDQRRESRVRVVMTGEDLFVWFSFSFFIFDSKLACGFILKHSIMLLATA